MKENIGFKIKSLKPEMVLAIQQERQKSNNLIDRIVKQFVDRSRKDIDKWRACIKEMEDPYFPKRTKYHAICKDISIDAHYHANRLIRIQSTMSSKFKIVDKAGEEMLEVTKLFEKPWFRSIMVEFLQTEMDGFGLMEITKVINAEIQEVKSYPKDRLIPEKKEVLLQGYEMRGVNWESIPQLQNYLIELGTVDNWGILYKIAPLIIWKRNAQQAWAEFSQLFGMPLRVAKTNKKDDATLDLLEDMLNKLGEAGAAVFPMGTELEFVSPTSTDSFNVYDKQIERCNSEISKAVNGVTMLSDNGSSRSQADVHFKVSDYIIEADMTGLESFINFTLFPKLINLGYPVKDLRFQWDMTETLSKDAQWKIVNEALAHFEVDPKYIEREFGIPILSSKAPVAVNPPPGKPDPVRNLLPKNTGYPTNASADSLHVHAGTCCGVSVSNETTIGLNQYEKEYTSLLDSIFKQTASPLPLSAFQAVSNVLLSGFKKGFKERLIDVDYNSPDNYKSAMYFANVFRFSAADSWDKVQNLNTLAQESKNFEEFALKAKDYITVTKSVLATEYQTAEATAQNAANWLRQVEEANEFDLEYQTMGDNAVRGAHQALDGFTAPVDDDIWNTIYPPNGWNCRCEVLQIPKGSRNPSPKPAIDNKVVQKGFKANRGKTNAIFDAGHSYFNEFKEVEKGGEATLNYKTYGINSYDGFDFSKSKSTGIKKTWSVDDFTNWFNKQSPGTGQMVLKNFLGLGYKMERDEIIKKFKSPKYLAQQRLNIAKLVPDMLANPDEAWINENLRGKAKYRTVYFKSYKEGLYSVVTETEEDKMNIITWYKVDNLSDASLDKKRNGILLKKKKD